MKGIFEQWFRRFAAEGPGSVAERLLWWLLLPLSWGFSWIAELRAWAYRHGLLAVYRAPVPVVSVGNLAVGGTGKTPTVDWVLHYLMQQGRRVAVVSRGYGGSVRRGVGIVSDGRGGAPLLTAQQCGDEPFLLAQRNPEVVVLVARRRRDGVALAATHFAVDLVLLDDGFQHRAVARDLDIVLLDARRPFGNGAVLPAGLLRESPRALQRGDLFILSRSTGVTPSLPQLPGPLMHCRYELSSQLRELSGTTVAVSSLHGKRGVAFAGVADPGSFFAGLRALDISLTATLNFPDHCAYGGAEVALLRQAAANADFFVTTEKDGVKLAAVSLPLPCYQVPLELVFDRPERLVEALTALWRKEP